jgi:hypothetical protein
MVQHDRSSAQCRALYFAVCLRVPAISTAMYAISAGWRINLDKVQRDSPPFICWGSSRCCIKRGGRTSRCLCQRGRVTVSRVLTSRNTKREGWSNSFFTRKIRLSGLASFASKWTGPGQTKPPPGGSLCAHRGPGRKGLKHLHTHTRG